MWQWTNLRPGDLASTLRAFWKSRDRKSTRLNSSHLVISYAVFCLKKKKQHLLRVYQPVTGAGTLHVDPARAAHLPRLIRAALFQQSAAMYRTDQYLLTVHPSVLQA